jgi:predicted transcriptional regulator
MGDSALQKGGYHHTTIISQNDTVQGSEAFANRTCSSNLK